MTGMLDGTHAGKTFMFPEPLKEGVIVSRPNRFIMMVQSDSNTIRCHCPTTGRLGDVSLSGLHYLFSDAHSKGRKTAHTVEAISIEPPGRASPGSASTRLRSTGTSSSSSRTANFPGWRMRPEERGEAGRLAHRFPGREHLPGGEDSPDYPPSGRERRASQARQIRLL